MSNGLDFRGTSDAGALGIQQVPDDAARLGLAPTDGTFVYQRDTEELWAWGGGDFPTGQWNLFGRVDNIDFIANTASVTLSLGVNAGSPRPTEPVTLTADVNLSAIPAAAGSQLVNLDIQADGLRAQILDLAIRSVLSASAPIVYDNTTGDFSMPVATDLVDGYLSATDHAAITAWMAANSQDVTVGPFGSAPNANGLTMGPSQVLNMEPADQSFPGGVSIVAQTFLGPKNFIDAVAIGDGVAAAASSMLDIHTVTKGTRPAPILDNAQMNAIVAPANGLRVYNFDQKEEYFYNGTNWEPSRSYRINPAQTIATGGSLTPGQYRRQVIQLSGTAAPATVADILATNALDGDELIIVCTDATNVITLNTSANTITNGTCTLGLDELVKYVYFNGKWRENYRSA